MRRTLLALGGVVLLTVSACSSRSHDAAPPTTSTPRSTTSAPGPYSIPTVITVAYVNSVFVVLNHVYSNAERELASTRQVNAEVRADLRAIFNDPAYDQQVQAAEASLKQGVINNVRPDGGDAETVVDRLITGTSACIFVETTSDPSALFVEPVLEPASEYFELLLKQPGADPLGLNSTPWAYGADEVFLKPTSVASKCEPA